MFNGKPGTVGLLLPSILDFSLLRVQVFAQAVTNKVNERDQGEIKDSAQAGALRDFLQKHSTLKPEVTKDSARKQTTVKGKGDVLVNFIELEHH